MSDTDTKDMWDHETRFSAACRKTFEKKRISSETIWRTFTTIIAIISLPVWGPLWLYDRIRDKTKE
jgi:hypothetical protein